MTINNDINEIEQWNKLVIDSLDSFIIQYAPTKVKNRYLKAQEHYNKALKLFSIDDEMSFIRLVAAEEELVVAVFEILKIKSFEEIGFVKKFKNHLVKISLAPILILIRYKFEDIVFHNKQPGKFKLVIDEGSVKLSLKIDHREIITPIPANITIGSPDHSDVINSLYRDFMNRIPNDNIREFIFSRADARNKILYSSDSGTYELSNFEKDIKTFQDEIVHLCWALAILIDSDIPTKHYDIVNQIILTYKKLLQESKII